MSTAAAVRVIGTRELSNDELKVIVKVAVGNPDTIVASMADGEPMTMDDRVCFLRCEPIGWTVVVVAHTERAPLGGPAEVMTFRVGLSEDDARGFVAEQYGCEPPVIRRFH